MGTGSHSKGGLRTVPLRRAPTERGRRTPLGGGGGLSLGELGAGEREAEGLPGCRTWTGTTRQPSQLSSPEACSRPTSRYPLVGGTTLSLRAGLQPSTVSEFLKAEGPPSPGGPISESRRGSPGGVQLLSWSAGHGRRAHRGAGWRGSCKDTRGRAGEIGAEPGKLGREELSQSSEKREHRGGGGAAGAAETLGVTEASGTPRPLHSGSKESREPARRRRMVGVGTRVGLGGAASGSCQASGHPA